MADSSADELRILFLTGGGRVGGMETHLLTLAGRLPSGVRCIVCCLEGSPVYVARLTALGIAHVNLEAPRLLGLRGFHAHRQLLRVVKHFRPHVVHSYGFSPDLMAGLLWVTGAAGARLVTSRRGEDANPRHQAVRRLVNRISDRVVCVSAETAAFVRSTESPPRHLLEVIPNGVELPASGLIARRRAPGEPVRFGTLGTVKPIKGTDLLVDAFLRFPRDERVELVVAGLIDRPWAEALRDRATADRRIRFVGRTSTPREFLAGLDVFVLPSRSEGMSNALLEAMAAGLPCVATDVGSNRSVLCPPEGAPAGLTTATTAEALFEAMRALARDHEARARYGAEGLATVRARHTVAGMVAHYERLYREISGRPATQAERGGDVPQEVTADA